MDVTQAGTTVGATCRSPPEVDPSQSVADRCKIAFCLSLAASMGQAPVAEDELRWSSGQGTSQQPGLIP